ncbi:hypothetical protein AL036_11350 [Salipiger aestuarii]|uniref:Uncharacterized protein n=1 Tax=Salipiger aestuarii TaxID=568098 RepID=A0A327Y221_9RHOB|nr:hypothetical protein C357_03520 [Citreicella sp. 357]KAA8607197.1 hypothetical protein AL036_11350 [Salipiger aestuarii]KAB2541666.1 hypothetical protein AL035_10835 [Salipiger aestuarii]RAK15248.1 hypothetical protein ATI53_10244 [Salipiger aestuarii]
MFNIRNAADAIAKLDDIDDTKKLDQSLRHLSQRACFPAEGRGRAGRCVSAAPDLCAPHSSRC